MPRDTEYPINCVGMIILFAATLASVIFTFTPSYSIVPIGMGDGLLLALLSLHFVWAIHVAVGLLRRDFSDDRHTARVSEALFFFGAFLFLFDYIYASNAGMDYVQRFIAGGGTIQLAPDTRTERLLVTGRYAPVLLADLLLWFQSSRRDRNRWTTENGASDVVGRFAPAIMVLSVVLSVLSYPSFVNVEGISFLGWVALAPLFLLIRSEVDHGRPGRAMWYGVLYGVLFTLGGNYWLGTFNLISLQAVGVIFFGFYLLYIPVAVGLLRLVAPRGLHDNGARPGSTGWPTTTGTPVSIGRRLPEILILPLSWTVFELARSSGFLGYPWLLVAHSQYSLPVMIQTAAIGGVWLVSFVLLTANAFLAEMVLVTLKGGTHMRNVWFLAFLLTIVANMSYGVVRLQGKVTNGDAVRIALIQQNSDPRKHDYRQTFGSLRRLTDEALFYDPDLVVWSETAFVPNIRRWSQEDPQRYSLAALVGDFLDYLTTVDTWLLTGNDDYRRQLDDGGNEIGRDNYNAAVLFSDQQERRETYHKVKLVPFTEHFPYRDQLPWVYDMLMSVDITFWTPGTEYTVFHHPEFTFATPICFEDVFPQVVRRFALEGMEVIVNISNDYWSLTEQAAQQHFAAALFRTVELGRPMVRATASGVTGHVDLMGRVRGRVPQYSEEYLIADVVIPRSGDSSAGAETFYYRWGDWFPLAAAGALSLIVLARLAMVLGGIYRSKRN